MTGKKSLLAGLGAIGLCWAVVALVFYKVEPEPMSARQILARQDWNAEELADVLGSSNIENASEEDRRAIFEHLRSKLEALPPEQRRQIMEELTTRRIEHFRRRWQHLSDEDKDRLVRERLKEIRDQGRKLTEEEKARMKERLQSKEGQAFLKSVMNRYQTDLTAEERAKLTPLVKEWFAQLEAM